MIKLSSRLQKVYDLIPACNTLADVGCDHGYLSIAAVEGKKAASVIAMDVNRGPLKKAEENFKAYGIVDKTSLRLSDGLKQLSKGEAEVICICGMGGVLIKRILSASLDVAREAKALILEPQSEYPALRSFLVENGFVFLQEDMASEEGKIYPIMKVCFEPDEEKRKELSAVELEFGPCILRNRPALLEAQLNKQYAEAVEIKTNLQSKNVSSDNASPIAKRIKELDFKLGLIEEARNFN